MSGTAAQIVVAFVALEHAYFLTLEMFLWTKPLGLASFRNTREFAASTRALAANQGLYNGFLAAGLVYSLVHPVAATGHDIRIFFLCCVVAAGAFAALTFSKRVFFLQSVPALIALGLTVF